MENLALSSGLAKKGKARKKDMIWLILLKKAQQVTSPPVVRTGDDLGNPI